jgi:hypothetical protein
MTAEEREWEANREARHQWTLRVLNGRWRALQEEESRGTSSAIRRRLFPWRIRIERLG